MFKILHLTSNLNLKNSAHLRWNAKGVKKKKKKSSGNSFPFFLMIPTTGIQAADIISKSLNQNWWEIPSCHIPHSTFFFFFLPLPWFTSTLGHDESVFYRISLLRPSELTHFHKEKKKHNQRAHRWRQRMRSVLPAEYFPWPLHMVKAISQ